MHKQKNGSKTVKVIPIWRFAGVTKNDHILWKIDISSNLNIYNGNICPSLNPAKIFQFISR